MDVNLIVADNLKAIRDNKKLSLDQVAKLTGVSKSMLGQIERGEVNPTISVVWKIANGLKISFTSLLDRAKSDVEIVRKSEIIPMVEDEEKFINYPIFTFDETKKFEQYLIEIKPGGSIKAEPHLAGTEEFITAFGGEVIITVAGKEFKLTDGDSIHFKSDTSHSYRNDGDKTMHLHMTIYYNQ
ncbi:MAG TPA: XRE family transcriptional regulator [Anaerovoracaceae bacterium]|nr:XRE family transcriptional regulator [Anaerovoracaceae bacterium]